jgi:2-polyprenyl-3-methyl-5-hydroxy-6-metoxy-1,4-benzoquinol methylase
VTTPDKDFGFDPDAPNDTSAGLYRMARAGRATVLHLGSGADGVSRALSALDDMKVTRVVADRSALEAEVTNGPDVFAADIEAAAWYAALDGRTYDVVMVADLLEHLRDPARLLRDLREQRLLADDGRLLVSFTNVAHEAVASELLSGSSARIRWYTASSMNRLLAASGYLVTETHHMSRPGTDDEAQTYVYVLQAQPSAAGPQLALLHLQLDETTRRLAEVESSRDQISALLEEERAAFRDEIGRGADELEQMQKKLSQVTDQRSALRNDIARLHRQLARLQDEHVVAKTAIGQLAAIRQSRSYRWSRGLARAGQVVVTPVRTVRQRMRGGR